MRQNLGLAVCAFAELLEARRRDGGRAAAPGCVLVVAGGYDKRLAENREHFVEVQQLVAELRLQEQARPLLAMGMLLEGCPGSIYSMFRPLPSPMHRTRRPCIPCSTSVRASSRLPSYPMQVLHKLTGGPRP